MLKKIKMEKSFCTEGIDWPEEICVGLTPALLNDIALAQSLLKGRDFIMSITIKDDGMEVAEHEAMDGECRIGYSAIKVFSHGWYWEIQGKYDSNLQAEYSPCS